MHVLLVSFILTRDTVARCLRRWHVLQACTEAFMPSALLGAIHSGTPGGVQTKYSVDKQGVNEWLPERKVGCLATVVNTKHRRRTCRQTLHLCSVIYWILLSLTSMSKIIFRLCSASLPSKASMLKWKVWRTQYCFSVLNIIVSMEFQTKPVSSNKGS